MKSKLDKSYNRLHNLYILERSNITTEDWTTMRLNKNATDFIISSNFISGNLKFRLKPYKLYFLRSFLWFIIKLCRPRRKTDVNKRRHVTIVILMIIGILVAIIIAYLQFLHEK